jgi:short subunit dehydrogenase-like uncharacterized protein
VSRRFDVVLYGASGFVGRQTVAYFARHTRKGGELRWALAGRSADRLRKVRAAAGSGAAGAEIIEADAYDDRALAALAADARVVLSTAGPFAIYGSELVAACVAQGAHYVDITGETFWVREMIDRHHAQAAKAGVRIVPCCGFDSVPSDLGAWLVARALFERTGQPCTGVKACHSMRGGINGGTLASAINAAEEGQGEVMADLFLLNPPGTFPRKPAPHADPLTPHDDKDFGAWLAPFVMGPVNTRVVRRSAGLAALAEAAGGDAPASPYARDFHYQEYLRAGNGPLGAAAAAGMALGLASGQAALRLAPLRAALRALVPKPGRGPSKETMDGGWFRCELIGRTASGQELRGKIAGRGDPGNRATTVFVCEAALTLALDADALPGGAGLGGVLTPSSALGLRYARRLAAAGMKIDPLPRR